MKAMSTLRPRASPSVSLKLDQVDEVEGGVGGEVEGEVDVALGPGRATGVGADEGDRAHALGREVARMDGQDALQLWHEVGIAHPGHAALLDYGSMPALCHERPARRHRSSSLPNTGQQVVPAHDPEGAAGEIISPAFLPSLGASPDTSCGGLSTVSWQPKRACAKFFA